MLLESRFFNSENKDRVYFAEDFAEYFSSFVGNGVNPNNFENERDFQGFKVESKEGMTLKINKGSAIIEGYYAKTLNNDDLEVKIEVADSRDRIDRIVLRLDYEKRMIDLVVLKGNISETAKPQDIVRNDDYYDLAIADVVVKGNSSHILQSNIKDTREDKTLCGWVETLISGNFEQIKKDFDEFVAKVEGITGGFQSQIDDINNYQIKAGSGLKGGGFIRNNPTISFNYSRHYMEVGEVSVRAERTGRIKWKDVVVLGDNDFMLFTISDGPDDHIYHRLYRIMVTPSLRITDLGSDTYSNSYEDHAGTQKTHLKITYGRVRIGHELLDEDLSSGESWIRYRVFRR